MMVIETFQLSRSFGKVRAVQRLDLRVEEGEAYACLGPHGAGKTTVIRMILGLIPPTEGRILLWGKSLGEGGKEPLSKVGALPEGASLFPHLTGKENLEILAYLGGWELQDVERALRSVFLTERDAERPTGEYSVGMKRRLGLAAALLSDPELLVLDGPCDGLDSAGALEVQETLASLTRREGRSIFLSSRRLLEVEKTVQRVGILEGGRLLFQGTLQEFRRTPLPLLEVEASPPERVEALLGGSSLGYFRSGELFFVEVGEEGMGEVHSLLTTGGAKVLRLLPRRTLLEEGSSLKTEGGRGGGR